MTVRANEPDIPQRPKTLSYRYENNGDSLTLREKPHVIAACFLGFWLTGWTIGCVLLIWQVLKEPSFFCFATPFWAAWIFVFCQLMMVIFGKTTVLLDCDGLLSEYRVLIKISSRQVPIDEIRYCHAIEKNPAGNDSESSCFIEAVTHGKPVHFSTTRFEEAEWLACEMNQMLMALKGKEQWKAMPDLIEVEDQHETDEQVTILLTSKPQNIEPPGDCRWKMSVGFDSVTFRQQGEFSLGALGYTTFTMIFWNGIVSVFVMVLWGFQKGGPEFLSWGWWGMFLFLIPFEVIGLIFFLAWFLALMAPFQRTRWSFVRDDVICRVQWFGIGWRWRYTLENCQKMVIGRENYDGNGATKVHRQLNQNSNREAGSHQLTFVDSQGKALCSITDLTLGEAQWIADNILRHR